MSKMPVTRSQKKNKNGIVDGSPLSQSNQNKTKNVFINNMNQLNPNLYTSIHGAVGGVGLNVSSDSHDYESCSEIISYACPTKEKEMPKLKEKPLKSKGRPKKITNTENNDFSSINFQNKNPFNIDFDINKSSITDLWSTVKSLHSSVVFISQQYDALLIKNEDIMRSQEVILKENRLLKAKQNKQQDDIIVTKKELERISCLVNHLEQEKLESSLVVKSLPELTNPESKQILVNVATKLNVNLEPQEIYSIQKLPLKRNHKFDYVFKLKSSDKKNEIMNNCKITKMILKPDLSIQSVNSFEGLSNPRIFITTHMTTHNYSLLRKAKLLYNFGFRYVWYKFGKVFARESNDINCKTIQITSLNFVDELILQRSRLTLNLNTNTTT